MSKRLSEKQVNKMLAEMQQAVDGGPKTWDVWHSQHVWTDALLEFPLGELCRPDSPISGFLWAWAMQKKIVTTAIEKGDRFVASGLEGKAQVRVSLITGLLAYRELPKHRRALYTL